MSPIADLILPDMPGAERLALLRALLVAGRHADARAEADTLMYSADLDDDTQPIVWHIAALVCAVLDGDDTAADHCWREVALRHPLGSGWVMARRT